MYAEEAVEDQGKVSVITYKIQEANIAQKAGLRRRPYMRMNKEKKMA